MRFSIITVAFNSAETISDTILSVASQTFHNVEHIIIDGASTDETISIVQQHADRLATIISEPDQGIYDAMNKGISAATGDVIGFLNADDVYANEHVLSTAAATFIDAKIEACYADLVYVDQHDLTKIIRYWRSQPYRDGLFQKGWMPAHPTFFARRNIYEKYGKFDLDYHIQSDFELTMRLLEVHKIKAVYIPEIFVKMRMGGVTNNRLSNIIKGNIEAYRACKKHGYPVTPIFMVRKVLSRLPQFFVRPK